MILNWHYLSLTVCWKMWVCWIRIILDFFVHEAADVNVACLDKAVWEINICHKRTETEPAGCKCHSRAKQSFSFLWRAITSIVVWFSQVSLNVTDSMVRRSLVRTQCSLYLWCKIMAFHKTGGVVIWQFFS